MPARPPLTRLALKALELTAPARNAVRARVPFLPTWTYQADGLATMHLSPFIADPVFAPAYERMVADWYPGERIDVRWRMWLLTRLALQVDPLDGAYAEYGVYRGGCAYMMLSTLPEDRGRELYLFDTYEGIPADRLTAREREDDFGGDLADTSVGYVERLLAPWAPTPRLVPGDVFETVPAQETGPLKFAHVDLNASEPTRHVLEHVHERLVPGAVVLLDDYGWDRYADQRAQIEAFLDGKRETIVALPTGQGFYVKAPG